MRRLLAAGVLVALIAALPLGGVAARASNGHGDASRVTGRVLHAGTGAPLPGARVRETGPRGSSAVADEDGAFVLPVGPGNRQVRVTADGFRPDRWDVAGALVALVGVALIMYGPR